MATPARWACLMRSSARPHLLRVQRLARVRLFRVGEPEIPDTAVRVELRFQALDIAERLPRRLAPGALVQGVDRLRAPLRVLAGGE